MKTLSELIKAAKFDYINSNITEENFPKPSEISHNLEILQFDRSATNEEVIKEMDNKGLRPANSYELLHYVKKEWDGKGYIVALGSVWTDSNGIRRVLFADGGSCERRLGLGWDGSGWGEDCRFPAVKSPEKLSPGQPLETLRCPHCKRELKIELL